MADFTANVHGVAWAASTAYALNDNVGNDTSPIKIYKCITAGTSAGSGGPTGTGSDITDGGAHWAYQGERHYTSLNAALSGESYNLTNNIHNTGQAGILTIDCYNFEDTAVADTGTGYITDASHYINIQAHDSHGGKWSTGVYRIKPTNWDSFYIRADFVNLNGIQIHFSNTSGEDPALNINNSVVSSLVNISNCIIKRPTASGDGRGIRIRGYLTNIWNTIIYGVSITYGISNGWDSGLVNCYNVTVCGSTLNAFLKDGGDSTLTVKNCYGKSTENCYSGTTTMVTCASSDTTGTAGLQNIAADTSTFTNVTEGSEDFHLPVGSALINVGTDLSGTFTTDIDGETRPTGAGTWDIGADEYIASGLAALNIYGIEMPWAQSANYR